MVRRHDHGGRARGHRADRRRRRDLHSASLAALIAVEAAVFAIGVVLLRISARRHVAHRGEGLLLGVAAGALWGVSDVAIKYLTHADGAAPRAGEPVDGDGARRRRDRVLRIRPQPPARHRRRGHRPHLGSREPGRHHRRHPRLPRAHRLWRRSRRARSSRSAWSSSARRSCRPRCGPLPTRLSGLLRQPTASRASAGSGKDTRLVTFPSRIVQTWPVPPLGRSLRRDAAPPPRSYDQHLVSRDRDPLGGHCHALPRAQPFPDGRRHAFNAEALRPAAGEGVKPNDADIRVEDVPHPEIASLELREGATHQLHVLRDIARRVSPAWLLRARGVGRRLMSSSEERKPRVYGALVDRFRQRERRDSNSRPPAYRPAL